MLQAKLKKMNKHCISITKRLSAKDMGRKTFIKTNKKKTLISNKRTFNVWVVVRHTRSGDQRIAVYDDKGNDSRDLAMERAKATAQQAANDYGHGSASVFKGRLILSIKAEQPTKADQLKQKRENIERLKQKIRKYEKN